MSSPDLASPIEIVDSSVLGSFVVWSGPGVQVNSQEQTEGFIVDWPQGVVSKRPEGLPQYEMSFHAKHANRPFESQEEHLAYVVSYALDAASGEGYVYLPGKGDAHHALNVRTIFRDREGHWFRATGAWNRAVMKALSDGR